LRPKAALGTPPRNTTTARTFRCAPPSFTHLDSAAATALAALTARVTLPLTGSSAVLACAVARVAPMLAGPVGTVRAAGVAAPCVRAIRPGVRAVTVASLDAGAIGPAAGIGGGRDEREGGEAAGYDDGKEGSHA